MKDADFVLRKAYTDAIKGNVSYNGKTIPLYDRVPNDAKPPWIKFGSFATIDSSDKDAFTTERLVSLEVHTAFIRGGGKKQADLISNQILQLIIGQALDGSPDFNFLEQRLESLDHVEDITPDRYIYNKILIINNFVEQSG
jgi:hypothetical protein